MEHLKFTATPEKGQVSAIYQAVETPIALFVLAHGAGANMQHAHMCNLAEVLAEHNISTFRFNFPFREAGGGRPDTQSVCIETINNAILTAKEVAPPATLYLSGHSFGGRMCSHFMAEKNSHAVAGLVYFSFPLHPAKKPAVTRAVHLPNIRLPQLFVSGTRDGLAELDLLEPVVAGIPQGCLHLIDTADHSFKVLKRTRTSTLTAYDEAGQTVAEWLTSK